MNEYLVSAIIYLVFLIASFFVAKKTLNLKSPWYASLLIIAYFVSIFIYFDLLNWGHQVLRDHRIYIEFGHASLLLIMVFFVCLITALLVTLFVVIKRLYNKRTGVQSI